MDNAKLIEAAKLLKDFCKNEMKGACFSGNCPLVADGICGICEPGRWKLPNPRRWTDREIALAKALKAFGAQSIGGRASVKFAYNINGTCCPVPSGAFAALNNGEEITIDEIIAEGENS